MATTWSFDSSQPIYIQIAAEITRRIGSGTYKPGEKLPSVREFALEAGVNPNTMARALADLEQKGLITTERATGKFVSTQTDTLNKLKQDLVHEHIKTCVSALQDLGLSQDEVLIAIQNYIERSA